MSKTKPSVTKQLNLLEHRLDLLRKLLEVNFLYISILPSPSPITANRPDIYEVSKRLFMEKFTAYGIGCRVPMHTHALTFHKPMEDCGISPAEVIDKFEREISATIPYDDKYFLDSKKILINDTYEDYSKIAKMKFTMYRHKIDHKAVSEAIKELQAERDLLEASSGRRVL